MIEESAPVEADAGFAYEKIAILRNASRSLDTLATEPIPRDLDASQAREATEYSQWLLSMREKIEAFANYWERALAGLSSGTAEMQEVNKDFYHRCWMLQQSMQKQNRQFTIVSSIMKVKYDTAKRAINNIRN